TPYVLVLRNGGGGPIATNTTSTTATFRVCPTTIGTNGYTVDVVDANGCSGRCQATVIVNPNPVCTITPPLTNICLGSCADLVVTPANGRAPYRIVLSGAGGPVATNTTSSSATFRVCP